MNKFQSKINKIVALFKTLEVEQASVDPSQLKISDKQVGGKVEIVAEDGTLSPAPDGDYQDEDGKPFTVKDGLITEWDGQKEAPKAEDKPAEMADVPAETESPEEEAAETNEVADLKVQVEDQAKAIEELKQVVAELQSAIQGYSEAEQAMSAQFNTQLEEINNTLKVIAKTPAEFSKTTKSNTVKDEYQSKFNDFIKAFQGNK